MKMGLIGRKVGMSQMFGEDGKVTPVLVIAMGPCWVTGIKQKARDGYCAVQLGFEEVPERKVNKAELGYLKKIGLPALRILKEMRLEDDKDAGAFSVGQKLTVDIFKEGEYVDVTGNSIGKGFQGVMKRHKFFGGPATHGSMSHRAPGSIGATTPSRVFKGKRMAGHMGSRRVTIQNLLILKVIPEQNLLLLKGAVPGSSNGYILVRKALKK